MTLHLDDPACRRARRGGVPRPCPPRTKNPKIFKFSNIDSAMAAASESKSWPGRREQLLHYRMIGALPSQTLVHAVAKTPRKRITPTPVVGHTWLLRECGNNAAWPIVESIM